MAGSVIAAAPSVVPSAAAARANVSFLMFLLPVRPAFSAGSRSAGCSPVERAARTGCCGKPMPSIGVRPESELLLASRPKSSKAMGFDDQQPADQGPCDNEDQERHGLDRDRDAECV